MPYAVQADIEAVYPGVLEVIASDDDGNILPDVVARGLAEADGIIDSHLSVQYTLPLVQVPEFLKACAIDIAVYRIAHDEATRSDEMRVRFEDCIQHLKRIGDGKAGLGVSVVGEDESNPDAQLRSASVDYFRRR